jgi:hypothetical protein
MAVGSGSGVFDDVCKCLANTGCTTAISFLDGAGWYLDDLGSELFSPSVSNGAGEDDDLGGRYTEELIPVTVPPRDRNASEVVEYIPDRDCRWPWECR